MWLENSGDFITIYDLNDNGDSRVIASLSGPDNGPQSYQSWSRWQKKIISSSRNNMMVEFKSDDVWEGIGFSASIYYTPLPSKKCEAGLNMTMKSIQSPNYPNFYDNNMACKWLISVPYDSHITLRFLEFDVIFSIIFSELR